MPFILQKDLPCLGYDLWLSDGMTRIHWPTKQSAQTSKCKHSFFSQVMSSSHWTGYKVFGPYPVTWLTESQEIWCLCLIPILFVSLFLECSSIFPYVSQSWIILVFSSISVSHYYIMRILHLSVFALLPVGYFLYLPSWQDWLLTYAISLGLMLTRSSQ